MNPIAESGGVVIPRKIWIMWYQGYAAAPYLVRKSIDSWRKHHPTWDFVFLDSTNYRKYVKLEADINLDKVPLVHQSELVRLALLRDYGGVWVDATAFCVAPLDNWIDEHCRSGFFAYARPAPDRLLSSWFLASVKGGPVATKLYQQLSSYWSDNQFNHPNFLQKLLVKILSCYFNRNDRTTHRWFSPAVTKIAGVYPYFMFHYLFAQLVDTDAEVRGIWENTVKVSADKPHLVQFKYGFTAPVTAEIKQVIDGGTIPMFKLNHRFDQRNYLAGTVLFYLLEELDYVASSSPDIGNFFG